MIADCHDANKVADWVGFCAETFPDKLAAVDLASGRQYSYAQWHHRIGKVAGALTALGVERGDRVASLAFNSTDVLDIMFACWRIGAIHLPLNFRLTADELAFIVGDAGPKVIIIDDELAAVGEALKEKVAVDQWLAMDGKGGASSFESAVADADPIMEQIEQSLDDLCTIMYSSGTTGRPKGVTLSHGNFYAVVNGAPNFKSNHDMVALTCMPLFHIGGLCAFSTTTAYVGGTTVIQRAFEPAATLAALGNPELPITHFFAVPAIFNALRAHPDQPNTDLSALKVVSAGAETVPDPLVKWWMEHGITIQEVYGMTETTGGMCLLDTSALPEKLGSAGKPYRHAPITIRNEDNEEVPRGEVGEICMAGPQITPGYWNRPDANEDAWMGGWFRSGDIGRMDEDGFVFVEDRVKDMYISGGENVYPAEVEGILYEIEAIREVAVIGVPHEKWGETGCAVVALKEGADLSIEEIQAHCEGRLAKFKQPQHMATIDAIPRNATGKVLKFELRQIIPAQIGLE